MSAAKLKNIVILALLLVNLFLLAIIIPTRLADLRGRKQANDALSQLYRQADVTLLPDAIPADRQLYPADLSPDHDAALDAVGALLGPQVLSQQTERGTRFSSSLGTADLSDDGIFAAAVTFEKTEDPEAHARTLLENMGISHTGLRRETSIGSVRTYSAVPTVGGVPVVTDSLHLRYEDGALTQITGLLLTRGTPAVSSSERGLSPQDALVAFLGSRISTGWMGSSVSTVTQGYALTPDKTQGVFHLQPVFHIVTDAGSYLVDGLSGAVTPT